MGDRSRSTRHHPGRRFPTGTRLSQSHRQPETAGGPVRVYSPATHARAASPVEAPPSRCLGSASSRWAIRALLERPAALRAGLCNQPRGCPHFDPGECHPVCAGGQVHTTDLDSRDTHLRAEPRSGVDVAAGRTLDHWRPKKQEHQPVRSAQPRDLQGDRRIPPIRLRQENVSRACGAPGNAIRTVGVPAQPGNYPRSGTMLSARGNVLSSENRNRCPGKARPPT